MTPAALRVVNTDTGELIEHFRCSSCEAKENEILELTKKMRGLAQELGQLRKDRDAEARAHQCWPLAVRLFEYWKEQTKHTRAIWKEQRFWLLLPQLQAFGPQNCAAAIAGIAYQHYTEPRKNGTLEHFDSWETVFADAGKVERYIKRRPADWVLPKEFAET